MRRWVSPRAARSSALLSHRISLCKGEGKPRAALGAALSACVLLAATVAARLLPVSARWYASVAGLLGFLGLVLFGLRPLLEYGSRALARVLDRPARAAPAPALLAAKNCGRVVGIRNVSRILGVLLSVVVVFAVSFGYCVGLLETAEEYFRCDFVVAGAGSGAAEAVGENEDTQAYCTAFLDASAEFSDGKTVFVISAEDASFLAYAPRRLPQGNEIVLSEAVAALYGLEIGDGVTLKIGRGKHEFVLAGYSGGLDYAAFIDASACGLEGNMLLIRSEAGTDLAAYRRSLADSLAAYGALVEDAQTLLSAQNSFLVTFLRSISVFIGGIFVIVAVGASDLVGVTYARRRGEMRSLRLAGMTRRNVAAMVVCEGCLLALAVCLVAAAGGAYLCWLLDCGMRSFGYALL